MNLGSGVPTDACMKVCEPVLRERLERVVSILESAQCAVNGITEKLFRPQVEENEKNPVTPFENGLEALIEKADNLACKLESKLNWINSKL